MYLFCVYALFFTIYVPWAELRLSGLALAPLPTEPFKVSNKVNVSGYGSLNEKSSSQAQVFDVGGAV